MSCVNKKHPVYQKILTYHSNPIGAEILFDNVMNIVEDDELYQKYLNRMSDSIADTIAMESPALRRVKSNVYEIVVTEGSKKILTLDQAYKVAQERASKINKLFTQKNIARVTTDNGPAQIIIEPNKQHTIEYIIKEAIKEQEESFEDYNTSEVAQVRENKSVVVDKVTQFNNTLKNIAKNIGVDVKFIDSLVNKHGITLNGLFKVTEDLKGLIQISKGSNNDLTLSEELSHAIIDGFYNLPMIQNLLKLIKKEGYEKYLGDNTETYRQMYNNNEDMLVREAAGKALSLALYKNYSIDSDIRTKIANIFIKFIQYLKSKFSRVSNNNIIELESQLDELSILVLGDKLGEVKYTKSTEMAQFKDKTRAIQEATLGIKRNLGRLKAEYAKISQDTEAGKKLADSIKEKIQRAQDNLNSYEDSKGNLEFLKLAGKAMMEYSKNYIDAFEKSKGTMKVSYEEFNLNVNYLQALQNIDGLAQEALSLVERFIEIEKELIVVKAVNEQVSNGKVKSYEELIKAEEDITTATKNFGALSNVSNKLAYTIGATIKKAQIDISSKQGDLFNEVKTEVDALKKWAKDNGMSTKDAYKIFTQEYKGTTVLTKEYTTEFYTDINTAFKNKDWVLLNKIAYKDPKTSEYIPINKNKYTNPNYLKIKNTKELNRFYTFYLNTMSKSLSRLPKGDTKFVNAHLIPNIMVNTLSDVFKAEGFVGKLKALLKYTFNISPKIANTSGLIKNEAFDRDIIPIKYIKKLTSSEKSDDLGESLFKFAAFTIEHEHLSEILPKTRILQRHLGSVEFYNPANPSKKRYGVESNIYDMVDKVIDIQLKGNKSKELGKINKKTVYDENGNPIGESYIDTADVIDAGLSWNSLLRIGLNPFTAITNVLVGDAGNIIEAFGNRFFSIKDLNKATNMYFTQMFDKESKMNYIIEKYPLMQELTDYEYAGKLRVTKGMTGEQLKNYMYSMQKSGEVFLQARTMMAMMFKLKPDGKTSFWDMLDDKGNLKPEYQTQFGTKEEFNEYMLTLSSRIMAVNEKIHGRYSQRDSAIITQNAIYRMLFQFKKWIPAAVEARFEKRKFDQRLGLEVEGRWLTLYRLATNLKDTATRMDKGQLEEFEKVNLRKTMTELTLILATVGLYLALGFDDDDKRKRSASYKLIMDQLDRVSGDLLFWANPKNITTLSKNPIPMTKLAEDIISVVNYLPYAFYIDGTEYKYKSGPRKGENKFYSKLGAITPGVKPTQEIFRLFNKQKYQDYTK